MHCAQCGGPLRVTDGSYTDAHAAELVECEDCGATGFLTIDDTTGTTSRSGAAYEEERR